MALIKSTILSSIRGSINGTTFSQNKSGAYARNRSMVVNRNTGNQILARGALAQAAVNWQNLSEAGRLQWDVYAAGTPVPNRLGDMIHLSGFNMMVKINAFYTFLGFPGAPTPPNSPGLAPAIVSVEAVLDSTSVGTIIQLGPWVGGSNAAEARYGFWIGNPVSPGVKYYKGPWTYVGTIEGNDRDTPPDPPITLQNGQFYYLRIRYGLLDQGKMSKDFIVGPIVVL